MIQIIKDSKKEIFTGIHATLSQGDYYTIEGTPLSKIPISWTENEPDNEDNRESCITLNGDGHDTEAQVLKDVFATIPGKDIMFGMPAVFQDVALIGFYDWGERGDWRTIHGQTLSEAGFSKFNAGEPNGAHVGEFCGSIHRSGLLNDLLCDTPCVFICEKSPDDPPVCRIDGPAITRNTQCQN
ncbi:hypothetical protein PYW07_009833 [Mythimna separata]|uniref:C-type lectin domain-containing protein n=1 Tax=Mythimna separata TaxID=271217 RepID=A0AAD8DPQ0_MYTSE|nr:hypothetical protein PYW07_009833 [Mythimna separata]